jgi:hypothetical protein
MKVTVTCLGPSVFELEGTQADVDRWVRAIQGKQRTFKGRVYNGGGERHIVAESVLAITVHDAATTPAGANKARRR